jgi:hypothetical protein
VRKFTLIVSLIAVLAALAVPAFASAAGYSAVAGVQSSGNTPDNNGPSAVVQSTATSKGGLPFTGLDVGLVLIGGVLLVGAGVTLRRFTATHGQV